VYDHYPRIGGLLTFGIPPFKLDKSIVETRHDILQGMGVEFRLGVEIGRDIELDALVDEYDAVFLGLGAYKAVTGGFPGEDLAGVHPALDYLIGNINHRLALPEDGYPYVDLAGKRVMIFGGGDTSMDCNRTALRQGAERVMCTYRRGEDNLAGSRRDYTSSVEEGVEFMFQRQPVEILGDDHVTGVRMLRTEFIQNERGQRVLTNIEGSDEIIECDAVVVAFGFRASPPQWMTAAGVDCHDNGRVKARSSDHFSLQTSHPKIFAGGDMVRGADLVVTAVFQGREAARGIARYLGVTAA
jgi:glutamate synthase (NADPH/NADH) small chain